MTSPTPATGRIASRDPAQPSSVTTADRLSRIIERPWFRIVAEIVDLLFGAAVIWLGALYLGVAHAAAEDLPARPTLVGAAPGGPLAIALVGLVAALAAGVRFARARSFAQLPDGRRRSPLGAFALPASLLLAAAMNGGSGSGQPGPETTRAPIPVLDAVWVGGMGVVALLCGAAAVLTAVKRPASGVARPEPLVGFIGLAAGLASLAAGVIWLRDAIVEGFAGAPGFLAAVRRLMEAWHEAGTILCLVWPVGLVLAGSGAMALAAIRLVRGR